MSETIEQKLSTALHAARRLCMGARTTKTMDAEATRAYVEQHANKVWASSHPDVAALYVCRIVVDERHGLRVEAEART